MVSGRWSVVRLRVLLLLLLGRVACAEVDTLAGPPPPTDSGLPCCMRSAMNLPLVAFPPPVAQHAFWDRDNLYLFGGVAAVRALDYTSTMNMLRRGRLELLLPGDIPRNHAGFAALEAAATATSIGLSYALHRMGYHKLERWLSIGHISVAGFGDARNYALRTHRPH